MVRLEKKILKVDSLVSPPFLRDGGTPFCGLSTEAPEAAKTPVERKSSL